MKEKIKWTGVIYVVGVIALIIGSIDPLEGSVAIAAGIALLALSTYLKNDHQWKLFLTLSLMILFGVAFLFYFSSLGGFGGKSTLSWWWCILILPYPIAWLTTIVLLIIRAVRKHKQQVNI